MSKQVLEFKLRLEYLRYFFWFTLLLLVFEIRCA